MGRCAMPRPAPDYLAAQAAIFEGRLACPRCNGLGYFIVKAGPSPECDLCHGEMRNPFTGRTTVTQAEADAFEQAAQEGLV